MTSRVDFRGATGRWALLAVALVGILAAVAGLTIDELNGGSPTASAGAQASLVSLTPVLPNLKSHEPVVISHPACDAYPPCTSAAETWSSLPVPTTFVELDTALAAWAIHNHLSSSTTRWECGPNGGLFGATGPGCQATFTGPRPNQSVFVATTFTDQSEVTWDPAKDRRNALADPLSALGTYRLATLAVQVVGANK